MSRPMPHLARILVVDGAVLARRQAAEMLAAEPGFAVLRPAASLRFALARIGEDRPDAVLLGGSLPDADGQAALAAIRSAATDMPVLCWGAELPVGFAIASAQRTIVCPREHSMEAPAAAIAALRGLLGWPLAVQREVAPVLRCDRSLLRARQAPIDLVVIGVSTGGPNALVELLPKLPGDLRAPILIVQHMPPMFTRLLAERLDARCQLRVREAVAGDRPQPGQVFVAPGDYHMSVERDLHGMLLNLDQGPPENSCRPAVDVLFRSAAANYGAGCLAVVLTGMGQDGLRGSEAVVAAGGSVLAQDEATSVVWGMPGFVARAGIASEVLPLSELAAAMERRVALQSQVRGDRRGNEVRS